MRTGKDPHCWDGKSDILLTHFFHAFSEGLEVKLKSGCFHHRVAVEDVTAVENVGNKHLKDQDMSTNSNVQKHMRNCL